MSESQTETSQFFLSVRSDSETSTKSEEPPDATSNNAAEDSLQANCVEKKAKKMEVIFNKRYVMEHSKRSTLGLAVIFNNQKFDDRIPPLCNRKGSAEDVKAIKAVLNELGFEADKIEIYTDKTDVEAIGILEEIANRDDLSECNCFFAVFLSHGDNGKLMMRKRELNIQGHILDHFRGNNCENLAGKPKIFLFQACRGFHIENSVLGVESNIDVCKEIQETGNATTHPHEFIANQEIDEIVVPSGADFLLCYASVEGFVSHIHNKKGSLFIQAFAEVMEKYIAALKRGENEHDFLSLMTVVIERVANLPIPIAVGVKKDKKKKRAQIPSLVSTLRRKIYFPNLTQSKVKTSADDEETSDLEELANEPNSNYNPEQPPHQTGAIEQTQEKVFAPESAAFPLLKQTEGNLINDSKQSASGTDSNLLPKQPTQKNENDLVQKSIESGGAQPLSGKDMAGS